jgi:hypothetical protein
MQKTESMGNNTDRIKELSGQLHMEEEFRNQNGLYCTDVRYRQTLATVGLALEAEHGPVPPAEISETAAQRITAVTRFAEQVRTCWVQKDWAAMYKLLDQPFQSLFLGGVQFYADAEVPGGEDIEGAVEQAYQGEPLDAGEAAARMAPAYEQLMDRFQGELNALWQGDLGRARFESGLSFACALELQDCIARAGYAVNGND